jgi:hypothetical protein
MMNLSDDIAEMFSAFAGRDRYADALERFCARALHRQQEYARARYMSPADREARRRYHTDYCRTRYQQDPEYRARRREAIDRYSDRRLGADRKRRHLGPIAIAHGTYTAYTKRGCRCPDCRAASAAYMRARRARISLALEAG